MSIISRATKVLFLSRLFCSVRIPRFISLSMAFFAGGYVIFRYTAAAGIVTIGFENK